MGVMASADEGDTRVVNTTNQTTNFTITVSKDATDKVDHTYGAFQLFKGDLAETYTEDAEGNESVTSKVLSNIQWGDSIDQTKVAQLITDLNAIDGLTVAAGSDAKTVAKAISDANFAADSAGAQAVADAFAKALGTAKATQNTPNSDGKYVLTVPAGYYLVKDTAAVTGEGAQTRYILEVVSNVEPVEKANVPSVIKKVKETDDAKAVSTEAPKNPTDWQDAADYDIGDSIPYKLEGTLPGKFEEFDTYKVYTFIDTLSAGLTAPKAEDVHITLNTENGTDLGQFFDVVVDGQVITVSLKTNVDLRTADYNGDDEGGKFVATDKIIVTYNAVLNENAKIGSEGNPNTVYLEFTNNPNGEQDGEKGTTPTDKVIVFTYEIKANKVEPDGKETITADAYAALTDAEKATYTADGDGYSRPKTKALAGAGFTLYKKVVVGTTGADANGWLQIGDEIKGVTSFEFKGTDAGEYKLVETTVPAGYNKADDVIITVAATYDTEADDPKLKTLTVTPETAGFTVTTAAVSETDTAHITTNGIVEGDILNQKGSVLPSTGGIGRRIFIVSGSILLVGAAILLITRRRMSAR
jgi:fimbrial isopeptide formation D2 family protein/LPXTG-motif cell wall-anchored protein